MKLLWSGESILAAKCLKRSFFQTAVTSILLYGCTTWTLTKRLEKKLEGNYTIMLRAILNKSWRQHPTRNQLYGHLPPITKTIQVRRTRHAGHCWRSRDELIRDVLLWTPTHGRAKAGRPARTYDREEWRERVRDIRATSATWWWWWWLLDVRGRYVRHSVAKVGFANGRQLLLLTWNCGDGIPYNQPKQITCIVSQTSFFFFVLSRTFLKPQNVTIFLAIFQLSKAY